MFNIRLAALASIAITLPLLSGCSGGSVVLRPQPVIARGTLDVLSSPITLTQSAMASDQNAQIITPVGGAPQCDVSLYSLRYETIGVNGEQANANAGLFVPGSGCGTGPFPIIAYAHGTNLVRPQRIDDPTTSNETDTAPDQLPIVVAQAFASHGYVVAATDYLGLGASTYPYHPYLHADSEASAVIDSVRAARLAAQRLKIPLSGGVFITGYSQGGQSAAATQRAMERDFPSEFRVLGAAPSSGPYALSQTFLDGVQHQSQDAPILAVYTFTAYQRIYGNVYANPTDLFQLPYANGIDTLLPVQTFAQQNALGGQTLPTQSTSLLQPAFVSDFSSNANNPARLDLVKNDLLSGWEPKAPVFLCGGKRDPEVEFSNALAAQQYFQSVGAQVTLTDVDGFLPASIPITQYHVTVADFCLPLARAKFFDQLKASAIRSAANR